MIILGIWDGHDSGAACLVDGRLVAAVNEERLTRRKLEIAFPARAIALCLRQAGVSPRDVTHVAASTSDPAKALERLMPWTKEHYYRIRRRQTPPGPLTTMTRAVKRRLTTLPPTFWSRRLSRRVVDRRLRSLGFVNPLITLFDHHYCHGMAAAHASGFDEATVVTIDGLGDGASATIGHFSGGRLEILRRSPARNSIGVFFEHVTELLNMRELEDEGKVMALADHAAPVPDGENPLLSFLRVADGRLVSTRAPSQLSRDLARLHWSTPNERFARMAQRAVEVACTALVRDAIRLTGCRRVALSGGVASNVKANRHIRHLAEVEDLFVFPHMGDGGLPVGAAVAAWSSHATATPVLVNPRSVGPAYSRAEIETALRRRHLAAVAPPELAADVARRLATGQIVCWFQGAMEYGPRALGQRSVLARPDSLAIKDRLNLVLKRRVWYQPFCPSLLERDAASLLDDWHVGGRSNPHMTMAYQVKPDAVEYLRGVVNVDGSCRPQILAEDDPTPFGQLLRAVRRETGLGVLLNTSFNIHGEPLVCTPDEAVDVFTRGGADVLVIGPFVVTHASPASQA